MVSKGFTLRTWSCCTRVLPDHPLLWFQRGSPEGPCPAAHGSSRQDGRKHHQLPQDGAAVNHLLGVDEGPDILTSGRTQHGHGQHDQGE